MKTKIKRQLNSLVGYSLGFLHSHPGMERQLKIDTDHVIVDRDEWERVVLYLNSHYDVKESIIKNEII